MLTQWPCAETRHMKPRIFRVCLKGVLAGIWLVLACIKTDTPSLLGLEFVDSVRVQNVQITTLDTTSVAIRWEALPPGKSTIELSTNAVFSSIAFSSGPITETSHRFTGLVVNTTYFYRVRTISPSGKVSEYAPNPVGSFTVPVDMNPDLPRTSCLELHQLFPSLPSGTYSLDTDGVGSNAPFQAYCDMTLSDGATSGGWTLILVYNDSQGTILSSDTPAAVVTPGAGKKEFMAYSRMAPLSQNGTQIAFRERGSATNYIISRPGSPQIRLLSYAGVGSAVNIFPGMNAPARIDLAWIRGSGISTARLTGTCVPQDSPYPENLHQTCGNGVGFHFIPSLGYANWNTSGASGVDFEVLIR